MQARDVDVIGTDPKHQKAHGGPQNFVEGSEPAIRELIGRPPWPVAASPASASSLLRSLSQSPRSQYLLQPQRTYGNRFVQRVAQLAQSTSPCNNAVAPIVESTIERKRGGVQPLSQDDRPSMGSAFGVDFDRVRAHADAESGGLNRAANAKAFTSGHDVFSAMGFTVQGVRQGGSC